MSEPTQEQMLWRGKVMTPDEAWEAITGADIIESHGNLIPANEAAQHLTDLRCTLGLVLMIQRQEAQISALRVQQAKGE